MTHLKESCLAVYGLALDFVAETKAALIAECQPKSELDCSS